MARAPAPTALASLLIVAVIFAVSGEVSGAVSGNKLGLKKEKLSQLRFYWHDIQSGSNPTSVRVISPPGNGSATFFGMVNMIDNALTMGPELGSEVIGQAQGLYASAAQKELSLMMAQNFAFTGGKYKGSTITLFGRNPVFDKVREMPVIGGTGQFRFCRGYATASTRTLDLNTGDAVVEYNVRVLHY